MTDIRIFTFHLLCL